MIKEIQTVEAGIERLFFEGNHAAIPFCFTRADKNFCFDYLEYETKRAPVLKWRYNPRWNTMREDILFNPLVHLGEPSTLKSIDIAPESETMIQLLCREMDLAEFFLNCHIISIMGFGCEKAANFIFRMDNGAMFSLEAAVTLPPDAVRESKHTLYTTNGMITDLVADKVVVTEQIYVFNSGKHPTTYTDSDINLFGLSLEEQDICYACYALIDGREDPYTWMAQSNRLITLAEAALNTLTTGRKFIVNESS